MSNQKKQSSEAAVREIRRRTRRKFSPEEKVRIVLEGLRGEQSVLDLCRQVRLRLPLPPLSPRIHGSRRDWIPLTCDSLVPMACFEGARS